MNNYVDVSISINLNSDVFESTMLYFNRLKNNRVNINNNISLYSTFRDLLNFATY